MQQQQPDYGKLLENSTDILCPECESETFEQITLLKKISALMTGTGEPAIIPLPAYRCTECKYIMQQGDIDGNNNESNSNNNESKVNLIK